MVRGPITHGCSCVRCFPVSGLCLHCSAFGDQKLKDCVPALPDIAEVDLDQDCEYLILACDGLWDFMEKEKVCAHVFACARVHVYVCVHVFVCAHVCFECLVPCHLHTHAHPGVIFVIVENK